MTAKELAIEMFYFTEELRVAQPMLRLDKKEDAIAYWENKILKVTEKFCNCTEREYTGEVYRKCGFCNGYFLI